MLVAAALLPLPGLSAAAPPWPCCSQPRPRHRDEFKKKRNNTNAVPLKKNF